MRRHAADPDDVLLARLADGTIGTAERARLEREVASSPQLAALLAEQQRALGLLAAVEDPAPAGLRARITAPPARRGAARRRPRARVVAVACLALVALGIVFAVRTRAPDVRGEIHLALARATLPAPRVSARRPGLLSAAVAGIPFPDWQPRGWRATGARSDSFSGRGVETVFYSSPEYGRAGYSIVAGGGLRVAGAVRQVARGGVAYAVLRVDRANVVTWRRDGHTCVIASRSVGRGTLLALAAADEQA
ncbi:MAG TPA: hypothetical protein VL977_06485 [Solirubrobacteraceae bacterium]|nr:hypothetical protein [Solirubrobacteraceae bacterium]